MKTKYAWNFSMLLVITLSVFLSFAGLSFSQDIKAPVNETVVQTQDEIPITTASKEARELFIQARSFFENMEFEKARTSLQDAVKADPDFALGYLGLALTGTKPSESAAYYKKAENLSGKVSEGEKYLISYWKSLSENDKAKAQDDMKHLMRLYPMDKRVQYYAGIYDYTYNEYNSALTHFRKTTETDENYAPAYNLMGYCYMSNNDFEKAQTAFKKYISLIPDNPNPYDSYAELLLRNGKYNESIEQYQKALSANPAFISSYLGIGHNYLFMGNFAKARESYKSAFDKSTAPNDKLNAMYFEAAAYLREGNTDEAVNVLNKRAALAESEGDAAGSSFSHQLAGTVLAENGKPDEAMKQFDLAMYNVEKSDLPAEMKTNMTASIKVNRVYGLIMQGKLDEAKAVLQDKEKLLKGTSDPDVNSYYELDQGLLSLRQKNTDAAMEHFSKAKQDNPLTWHWTAMAYEQKGDKAKAAEMREKIRKCKNNNFELSLAYYPLREKVAEKK